MPPEQPVHPPGPVFGAVLDILARPENAELISGTAAAELSGREGAQAFRAGGEKLQRLVSRYEVRRLGARLLFFGPTRDDVFMARLRAEDARALGAEIRPWPAGAEARRAATRSDRE